MIVKEFYVGNHRCVGYTQSCQYASEIAKREGEAKILIKFVETKNDVHG